MSFRGSANQTCTVRSLFENFSMGSPPLPGLQKTYPSNPEHKIHIASEKASSCTSRRKSSLSAPESPSDDPSCVNHVIAQNVIQGGLHQQRIQALDALAALQTRMDLMHERSYHAPSHISSSRRAQMMGIRQLRLWSEENLRRCSFRRLYMWRYYSVHQNHGRHIQHVSTQGILSAQASKFLLEVEQKERQIVEWCRNQHVELMMTHVRTGLVLSYYGGVSDICHVVLTQNRYIAETEVQLRLALEKISALLEEQVCCTMEATTTATVTDRSEKSSDPALLQWRTRPLSRPKVSNLVTSQRCSDIPEKAIEVPEFSSSYSNGLGQPCLENLEGITALLGFEWQALHVRLTTTWLVEMEEMERMQIQSMGLQVNTMWVHTLASYLIAIRAMERDLIRTENECLGLRAASHAAEQRHAATARKIEESARQHLTERMQQKDAEMTQLTQKMNEIEVQNRDVYQHRLRDRDSECRETIRELRAEFQEWRTSIQRATHFAALIPTHTLYHVYTEATPEQRRMFDLGRSYEQSLCSWGERETQPRVPQRVVSSTSSRASDIQDQEVCAQKHMEETLAVITQQLSSSRAIMLNTFENATHESIAQKKVHNSSRKKKDLQLTKSPLGVTRDRQNNCTKTQVEKRKMVK